MMIKTFLNKFLNGTTPVHKKPVKPWMKKEIRDGVTVELLDDLLKSLPRNKFIEQRAVLCILLLYITGCRINELRNFNFYSLQGFINDGSITIYAFKTKSIRRIDISENERLLLKSYKNLIQKFYKNIPKDSSVLCAQSGKELHNRTAIMWLNKLLKDLGNKYGLTIKSHSFRIGYITNLLKKHNVQVAKSMIGHSNIETTLRYDRNILNSEDVKDLRSKLDSDSKLLQLIDKSIP